VAQVSCNIFISHLKIFSLSVSWVTLLEIDLSFIDFAPNVSYQKWSALRSKIDTLKDLLARVHFIAPPEIKDLINNNTGAWMAFGFDREAKGVPYQRVSHFFIGKDGEHSEPIKGEKVVCMKDYHHTEADFLRGKLLIQKIFDKAEPLSEVRRLIACSQPYSTQPSDWITI
jgi:hypothetical protein